MEVIAAQKRTEALRSATMLADRLWRRKMFPVFKHTTHTGDNCVVLYSIGCGGKAWNVLGQGFF